ncbi:MAG: filamentous hemagglutinin family protein [Gammaproteobacteria bacterium]
MTLRAAALRGYGAADATFDASTITLVNDFNVSTSGAGSGNGKLSLNARDINLGSGSFAVSGFSTTGLTAARSVHGTATGGGVISVAGDLNISTSTLNASSGATQSIDSGGVLTVTQLTTIEASAVNGIGASLTLSGRRVEFAGNVVLPSGKLAIRATGNDATDDVHIGSGAKIQMTAVRSEFSDKTVYASAGSLELTSAAGSVRSDPVSLVDVSAKSGGDAGSLTVTAANGTVALNGGLDGEAVAGFNGGRASLDAATFAYLSKTNAALNAGGFTRARTIRQRTGDVVIEAGDVIQSREVSLTADSGGVQVRGTIDASGSAGGKIGVNAKNDIEVASAARMMATASDGEANGGSVRFSSVAGGVKIASGSLIDVSPATGANSATQGGEVSVRVSRDIALTVADANASNDRLRLDGNIQGARRIDVEPYKNYDVPGGSTDAVMTTALSDASNFATQAPAIKTGLGFAANDTHFHVLPGIQISNTSSSPMTVTSTIDLSSARFNGEPGVLTLRSAGNVEFAASLSDGFSGVADLTTNATPSLLLDESWSYRIIAGADTNSANIHAVSDARSGDVIVRAGIPSSISNNRLTRAKLKAIRTGTGDIDIAAAGSVILENRASVIYTAGHNSQQGIALGSANRSDSLQGRPYPDRGGDILITAGEDVTGIGANYSSNDANYERQLVSSWQFRQGDAGSTNRATGWTTAYEYFEQGIGALAGGDVTVTAGRDISNLGISTASVGRQIGGTTQRDSSGNQVSKVLVTGGGALTVSAGRDVNGGVYYVGRGEGSLQAGGSITAGRTLTDGSTIHAVVALGDASMKLKAVGDVQIDGIVNPTFISQGPAQKVIGANRNRNSYFLSYGADSGVDLLSLTGNVALINNVTAIHAATELNADLPLDLPALSVAAPNLTAVAMSGSVSLDGDTSLAPSATGNVSLLAADSVLINANLALSDADPTLLPTLTSPGSFTSETDKATSNLLGRIKAVWDPAFAAATPVHSVASGVDNEYARIVANRGDIRGTVDSSTLGQVFLSRQSLISAGGNITNLNLIVQNNNAADVSEVRANGDIRYDSPRFVTSSTSAAPGSLDVNPRGIEVWGPGRMVVEVGRNIELGTANGITSNGNLRNINLPADGASLSIFAGLGDTLPDYDAFVSRYLVAGSEYEELILDFMRSYTKDASLTAQQAYDQFTLLPRIRKSSLVLNAFFTELRTNGRKAATVANSERDFSRGDMAINTLFPAKHYAGDVNLYFSQIFTKDGGDIDLLAPGGNVNVGLATPPVSFGISKSPDQLGIVTEGQGSIRTYLSGNFEVNESRTFAADGGDILIWSSLGDIDAGKGAKSALSVPAIGFVFNNDGQLTVSNPPPIQGSGIRALVTTPGREFGSVDLFTPVGVVNASEAGIESAGNITIAAVQVLGADNIKVGGVSTGVPTVSAGGIGAGLAGAGDVASAATKSVTDAATKTNTDDGKKAAEAAKALTAALNFINVEFLGFGEG